MKGKLDCGGKFNRRVSLGIREFFIKGNLTVVERLIGG